MQTQAQQQHTTATYDIDPGHAHATFKVRHLMVSNVRGEMGPVSGRVVIDTGDITRSQVHATVQTGELTTRNEDRDAHLRSADFFDVERFPHMVYDSSAVELADDGSLTIHGDLTIRGVTRHTMLTAELSEEIVDPWGNAKRGVTARARIDRKQFGITWNAVMDAGGVVVGDLVDITIELELVRRPA